MEERGKRGINSERRREGRQMRGTEWVEKKERKRGEREARGKG